MTPAKGVPQAPAVPSPRGAVPVGIEAEVLAQAWQCLPVAMVIADEWGTVLLANPAAAPDLEAAGCGVGRPLKLTAEATSDGNTPLVTHEWPLRQALAGHVVQDQEYALAGVSGAGPRRVLVSALPVTRAAAARLALLTWRDAASRWPPAPSRQEGIGQLHRLMDAPTDHAIFMLDPDGRVLTWGPAAERLLRCREPEILGRTHAGLFSDEERAAGVPEALLSEALCSGRAVTQGERVRADGSRFAARGVVTAQRDAAGALVCFIEVVQDVTDEHLAKQESARLDRELRAANEQLENKITLRTTELQGQANALAEANQELEAFSYGVSHDLRAPLRSLAGFATILQEDHAGQLDEQGLLYLDRIRAAVIEMGELIEGMLRLSRVQRHTLELSDLDMTAAVRAAWENVAAEAGDVRFDLATLPSVCGDRQLVSQVWINLLGNAVKFSQHTPDARIRVWAEEMDGQPVYVVADNGVGFPPDQAGRLFKPFQRLHRAADYPGTGIGLALVNRIVRRHEGRITASSTAGEGACFRFTLGPTLSTDPDESTIG